MIKLNNKNITYVALADSNNSIKAPKEIWYADSANSVKLVYRRKDTLIEGEDYEKYHWLVGDGSAYMIKQSSSIRWVNYQYNYGLIKIFDTTQNGLFFEWIRSDKWVKFYLKYIDGSMKFAWHGGGANVNVNLADGNLILKSRMVSTSRYNGTCINNEVIYNILDAWFLPNENMTMNPKISAPEGVGISQFEELNTSTNEITMQMYPCKLLKPVPKWLDANGIRRQVGECGMIDLVSGKFYGNVNNAGTFTVENYYERKEWLVGDGSAYIDTLTPFTNSDVVEIKVTGGTLPDANQAYKLIFGNSTLSYNYNTWVLYGNSAFAIRPTKTSSYDEQRVPYNVSQELSVIQSTTSVTINGNEVWSGTSAYTEILDNCTLFAAGTNISHCYDGKVAYLRIPDKLDLIPCTLTMDLPASMDANNIARTKGTSGMWDLVSDRFYGNVANGGAFKAVNLAEGVDYEVHDWLVGDRSAYMFIGEYSESVKFKIKLTSPSADFGFIYGGNGALRTHKSSNTFNANIPNNVISRIQLPSTKEILIDFSEHLVYADDVQIAYTNKGSGGNDESAFKKAYFWGTGSWSIFRSDCSIGTIYADNQVFIPVQLLKSIPSKYDANGIARQAGECGMYDTVNDVFYGNVASSGTFTVEDDN